MSRIKNTALIKWTNMNILEEEINSQFSNNPTIDIKDIVIFAKISPYSYYPIETAIDDEGKIRIKNSEDYIGLKLFVGSKCQFLHKRFTINDDSYKIELDEYFKTAWNPKKFIIFQDGYLMNPGLFTFIIPSFENNYYRKYIYSTTKFKKKHGIDVYYIESDDNFSSLPASRDMYVGAIRYIARKNNEKIVPIPYPFKDKKSSFFIFNEQGHYLDKGTDYVVSYDEVYITLKRPLKLATVDYIIFAFPIIQKEKEMVESTEVFGPLSGYPYFKYSYSVEAHYNVTGLVRFLPIYEEYVLTKKNFLLFGDGEWVNPNRFEVHSNDAIIFNNRADQEICANIHYTMVIFEDNTDHSQFSLPRDFFVDHIKCKEPNQRVFKVEHNIPFKCKSFVIFKNNQLVTEYYFDEDSEKIHFKNPVNEDFYLVWFSTQVNNTNQEILVYTTSFPCYKNGPAGTVIPENYVLNNLTNSWVLVFFDGRLLNPTEYKIRDGKVYLNSSIYTKNGKPISLEGSVISLLLLISGFKKDPIKRTEKQIQMIQKWQEEVDYDLQETAYFYIRSSARPTERGVIPLLDRFDGYKLNKRNMLLFNSGGTWIDPQRFDLIDNDRLYLVSPLDHERSLYTSTYYAITMDDKLTDKRYSPPNIRVVHVKVEEDYQSLFEIPKLHRRFRTFILFKGSLLLNKEYNYVIENETHVKLTNPLDYMKKGRSLTFVFLDAHSRIGQETIFIQSSFKCKLNQATPIPNNFLHKRFNTDHIAIFLNGLFMSPDKYKIINNSILLDGFIELDTLDTRIFTILYITSIPIGLRPYDYFIPPYPDIPIKERDIVPAAYFTHLTATNHRGQIIDFSPEFTGYPLDKKNLLLFANKRYVYPNYYQLYSNNKLIWSINNMPVEKRITNIIPFPLIKKVDTEVNGTIVDLPEITNQQQYSEYTPPPEPPTPQLPDYSLLPQTKSIDVNVNGRVVDVPFMSEQYKSFVVFDKYTGKFIDLVIDNEYDIVNEKIILHEDMNTVFTFVYLRSYLNADEQLIFNMHSFIYNGTTTVPIDDGDLHSIQVFHNGDVLSEDEYTIANGIFKLTDSITRDMFRFDYSTSIEVVDKRKSGKISFENPFSSYQLRKNNCLLFGNMGWIDPERFEITSNSTIQFIDDIDKDHSDYVNYTMVIPTNDTEVTLHIHTITATQDKQKVFTLPHKFGPYTTFLVFKGGLLVPNDRVYIEDTMFMFKSNTEYLAKGRSFSIITIDTSKSTWVYPAFKQQTFMDNNANSTNGISIPDSWDSSENNIMLFIGNKYVPFYLYRIENNKIFLNEEDMYDLSKSYTLLTIKQLLKYSTVSLVYSEKIKVAKTPIKKVPSPFVPADKRVIDTIPFPDIRSIDVNVNGRVVDVPFMSEQYKSFVVFDKYTGKFIDLVIDNEYDIVNEKIILHEDMNTVFTFVYLRSYMTFYQQLLFYSYGFLYTYDYKIPLFDDEDLQYLFIFRNGEYLRDDEYTLTDGIFNPVDPMLNTTFRFDYSTSIEVVNKKKGGKILFNNSFSLYPLKKNNFLLFGNGTWIHPNRFEVYDSDKIIFTNLRDQEHSDYVNYTMVIPTNDTEVKLNIHTLTATQDKQKIFTLPHKFGPYTTFLVFKGGLLVPNDRVYIEDTMFMFKSNTEYLDKGRSFYIITIDTSKSEWVYPAFKQKTFVDKDTNPTNGIDIPKSFYEYEDMLNLFIGGRYIDPTLYRIENHKIYLTEDDMYEISKSYTLLTIEKLLKRSTVSLVYLLSLVPDTEDHYDQYVLTRPRLDIIDGFSFSYSYSTSSNNGTINFSPSFEHYSLEKNNFLLFGNGHWINPNRFNLSSNIKFSFISESDKQQSNSTNYTMIIPNEGHSEVFKYSPVTLNLHTLIATQDNQQTFDLPELTPYSTLLVFNDEGILIPVNKRILIKNNQLIFKHSYDYLQQDQSLHVVILDDSNTRDRQYPAFVQDTFNIIPDASKGTPIPSDWYMYENNMLVFFEGQYLSSDLYTIEDHKIFLESNFASQNAITSIQHRKKYTLVYLASNVIEEYWEKVKPPIYAEPTPKRIIPKDDPLDFTGYYFDIYESEYDVNGYITYDPGFTAYSLTKADFLLFGNSTFIHPSRYTFNNNKSLRMIDEIDRRHSPFALYNMVIPFSKDAKDFYKEDYVKPKFQIVEIVTTERTNELEFPVLDAEYESVLMFRNSLILPIYDEDRFVIDDINHKFMIVNEADWIPANTTVTFIFMSSKTNTDTKILLVQDSFKCVDYFTQIPNSIYRYPGQKFNKAKMLLYLNGTFVVPERYVMHNNTIFLVDDDIDLNDDHTFTIVYLDEVHSTEYDIESNVIDRTYEDGLDDIIFETAVVKPV